MNSILFIVEGENDEVKYIEHLFKVYKLQQGYTIVPYKTNLYILAKSLLFNNEIDKY